MSQPENWSHVGEWGYKEAQIYLILHLGLALLFFLINIFHILALLGSEKKAGFFLHTAPCTVRRQRRVCPMWGCFPQGAPEVCCTWLLPNPLGTTSSPFLVLTREPLLVCSVSQWILIQCSSASSGTWVQQPAALLVTSPSQSLHLTFMSQAPFKTQRRIWTCFLLTSVTRWAHTVSFYHRQSLSCVRNRAKPTLFHDPVSSLRPPHPFVFRLHYC